MPRDGSLILSDLLEPTLAIGCERCGRHGRYNVRRLIAAHGRDARLPDLLAALANCEKSGLLSIHDRCMAKFEGFRDGSLRFRLRSFERLRVRSLRMFLRKLAMFFGGRGMVLGLILLTARGGVRPDDGDARLHGGGRPRCDDALATGCIAISSVPPLQ
jgi:hypothetical protein